MANRPFEHDARLKELLTRQAQLNAALDLDKSDGQASGAGSPAIVEAAIIPIDPQAAISPRPVRSSATLPGS